MQYKRFLFHDCNEFDHFVSSVLVCHGCWIDTGVCSIQRRSSLVRPNTCKAVFFTTAALESVHGSKESLGTHIWRPAYRIGTSWLSRFFSHIEVPSVGITAPFGTQGRCQSGSEQYRCFFFFFFLSLLNQ